MLNFKEGLTQIVKDALIEDCATDDVTTKLCINNDKNVNFNIIAQEDMIFCGSDVAAIVFNILQSESSFANSNISLKVNYKDGASVTKGQTLITGTGNASLIFAGERVILNIIQHLSGIASITNLFVNKLNNNKIKILDTRKTLPNLRFLQKYAVKQGGGDNHRFSLSDMVLIKDNHINAAGGIKNALECLKKSCDLKIEIECDNLDQVKEAAIHKPDFIMLDNMSPQQIKDCIAVIRNCDQNIKIEVSGGITLENISQFSNLDINFISIGYLTHSSRAADISLECIAID